MIVSSIQFTQVFHNSRASILPAAALHDTLDRLYVMVLPDGSMTIPSGADYLSFGPFLKVTDFEQVLTASQFDSDKHLHRSRGWGKESISVERTLHADRIESLNMLKV